MNAPPYSRKISPTERLYMSIAAAYPPFCLHMVVDGSGAITPDALRKALKTAADKNPGCRLIVRKGRWVDSLMDPQVTILAENTARNPRSLPFMKKLDLKKGPSCEVYISDGPDTRVIFRASHAVMDGKGLQFWVEETFRALRGEPLLGTNTEMTDHDVLYSFPQRHRRQTTPFTHAAPQVGTAPCGNGFAWAHAVIPGAHQGFVAKVAAALAAREHGKMRFMVPVDLRGKLPEIRTTANMTSPLILNVSAQDSPDDIQRQILAKLQMNEERAVSPLDHALAMLPPRLLRILHKISISRNRFPFSATLSHIGKLDPRALSCVGFNTVSIAFLPVDVPAMPLTLVSAEMNGSFMLWASMPGPVDGAAPREILRDIGAALRNDSFLEGWNATDKPYPRDLAIHTLFERQASLTPDAPAVSMNDTVLTYRDLNLKADAIASHLIDLDVRPGDRVAVCMPRSVLAPACLLGILKAGAVFVPLDPGHPRQRIRTILDDSGTKHLLAQHDIRLEDLGNVNIIHPETIVERNKIFLPETGPNALAYIIYTSGSTGNPKGVAVSHGNLVNYLSWAKETYLADLVETSVFGLFTSLAFDLTLTSIFLPLTAGGSVEIHAPNAPLEALRTIARNGRVNCLKLTPSHLSILQELRLGIPSLRRFIVGGENLSTALARDIHRAHEGRARIFNEYGPTEATVGCMVHEYAPEKDTGTSVPLGRPAANTRIYVLDTDGKIAARGMPGEIYIAGDCLAAGYFGNEQLTRERFLRLREIDPGTAYRTGDLAEWGKDGKLYYSGRSDRQLKIRGHRVEPGEIENILGGIDNIGNYIVTSAPGFLTAFYTARAPVDIDSLKHELAKRLPSYMQPRLMEVAMIPLTINGKADERALCALLVPAQADEAPAESENPVMKQINSICAQVMNRAENDINPDCCLFSLGLDSLGFVILTLRLAREILPESKSEKFMNSVGALIDRLTTTRLGNCLEVLLKEEN